MLLNKFVEGSVAYFVVNGRKMSVDSNHAVWPFLGNDIPKERIRIMGNAFVV